MSKNYYLYRFKLNQAKGTDKNVRIRVYTQALW